MPANTQNKFSRTEKGAILGGTIGLVGGPAGVLFGASLGGTIGKVVDLNNERINRSIDDGILKIVIWDVQHGSAIYIKTPNGKNIVQDLGTGSCYGCYNNEFEEFSPLNHLKKNYGIKRLDYTIITHLHKDHIDDIMNLRELSPKILNRPVFYEDEIKQGVKEEELEIFENYFELDRQYSAPVDPNNDPLLYYNNGGADIKVFDPGLNNIDRNERSLVTTVSYAKSKIMLPGDNGPVSWKKLLERQDFKNAIKGTDVLLAAHHGRESGFYPDLFEYIKPKLTIISDGPEKETSVTDKYSKISFPGFTIYHRNKDMEEERNCLTTRKDGVIIIELGYKGYSSFMNITAE